MKQNRQLICTALILAFAPLFSSADTLERSEAPEPRHRRAPALTKNVGGLEFQTQKVGEETIAQLNQQALALIPDEPKGYDQPVAAAAPAPAPRAGGVAGETIEVIRGAVVVADDIVNLGVKIFNVIERGSVRADIKTQTANGIPRNSESAEWQQLTQWSKPVGEVYTVPLMEGRKCITTLSFLISFRPNGKYNNKGNYIRNVTILPTNVAIDDPWFTKREVFFNAAIKEVVNENTSEDPVAGITIDVAWGIGTGGLSNSGMQISINGKGEFSVLGAGSSSGRVSLAQCRN